MITDYLRHLTATFYYRKQYKRKYGTKCPPAVAFYCSFKQFKQIAACMMSDATVFGMSND